MMLTRSDELEIVLTVVDAGGFSAAAEILNMQVAKVSRAVAKVESQLGVSILNRTTRRVRVTDEGRVFIEAIRKALYQIQTAEADLVARGTLPKGKLRVNAATPFVLHQLVPLVQSFTQAYPEIDLEITSDENYVDLLQQKADVAIRIGTLSDSSLQARLLGQSALHVVASPAYLSTRGVPNSLNELTNHIIIGFSDSKALNTWPIKGLKVMTPNVQVSNGETVRQLALAGNGIACLSGFMVGQDIERGALLPLFTDEKVEITGRESIYAVYYKSSAVSKRVSAFLDFIQPRLTL